MHSTGLAPLARTADVLKLRRRAQRAAPRVLVVGFSEQNKYFGHLFYATHQKLRNGLVRAGASVTWFSDRDWASQMLGVRWFGRVHANRRLLELVATIEPDVLILMHADLVSDETIREIRRVSPRTRVVTVYIDDISTPAAVARFARFADLSDLSFVTTAGPRLAAIAAGARGPVGFIPNPVDAAMENVCSYLEHDHTYDVFFCGKPRARQGQLAELRRLLPDRSLGIFLRQGRELPLSGAAYVRALGESRIALNLALDVPMPWYASDRIAQLFAAGCLVAVPRVSGLQELYGDKGIIAYRTIDEFARKVRDVIDSGEWRAMARRGRDRAVEISDASLVARYILDRVDGSASFEWPDWTGEFYG